MLRVYTEGFIKSIRNHHIFKLCNYFIKRELREIFLICFNVTKMFQMIFGFFFSLRLSFIPDLPGVLKREVRKWIGF